MSAASPRKVTDMNVTTQPATQRKSPALGLNAKRVISKRYSLKDAKGRPIEEWQDIVRRVVGHVSAAEKDPRQRDEFFASMSDVMIEPLAICISASKPALVISVGFEYTFTNVPDTLMVSRSAVVIW